MKAFTEKLLHYISLAVVTLAAVWVMWYMTSKNDAAGKQGEALRPLAPVAAPKAPVLVEPLDVEPREIYVTYSGKIQPWETHQVSFEVPGRVSQLGTNDQGESLDDGDLVKAGQVLAKLDDRVYRSRKSESAARVEQATSDLQRAQSIRRTNPAALTEAELQALATELALARAQHEVNLKNLEDATLTSPVDATISRRLVNPDESVGANQVVFELVEIDEVLLVVDVPESKIRDLEQRMRTVERNRTETGNSPGASAVDSEDLEFRAYVQLEGRDRFGNRPPPLVGEVYRIAEVADPRTGLFAVEIRLPNREGLLRPGMVATAQIVTARIAGYEVPEVAVIFRGRQAYLFGVEAETAPMEVLYWTTGETTIYRARRIDLKSGSNKAR